ncbi:MAG: 50S ribosomal protein L4 [Alphaproteobacteria bacterium]|nr:50S ribosomal protein L4 [Alphaproteobacteria bacterium]OJV16385.1 MAG: 50S ribosomal protein L4 [Alphaproteobacteria bacterium 33-17]
MLVDVINLDKNKVGSVELNDEIYALPARQDILHMMVNYQLAKRRSGNHKTKGISEISGTTRKPYAQKGTGRARQGSLRSPQFRGGAVIFGPVVRDHSFDLTKKFRKLALKHALSVKSLGERLIVVDSLAMSEYKTKALVAKLETLGVSSALFVSAEKDENFAKACSNIIGVDVIPAVGLNVYDILKHDYLVVSQEAVKALEERLNG